jgi:hypothetical protein
MTEGISPVEEDQAGEVEPGKTMRAVTGEHAGKLVDMSGNLVE